MRNRTKRFRNLIKEKNKHSGFNVLNHESDHVWVLSPCAVRFFCKENRTEAILLSWLVFFYSSLMLPMFKTYTWQHSGTPAGLVDLLHQVSLEHECLLFRIKFLSSNFAEGSSVEEDPQNCRENTFVEIWTICRGGESGGGLSDCLSICLSVSPSDCLVV